MDALLQEFEQKLSIVDWPLRRGGEGVYCAAPIPRGAIVGEIMGVPRYIWEIAHDRYMIVDRDYVIDVSAARGLMPWIREENMTMNAANCTVVSEDDRFFLQATVDIAPGTELVYFSMYV
jgi:hypothetical protein